MIQGKDLILSLNGAPLAASTTCELSTDTDFIEVCPPTGGEWKDYIPTQHGWGVSAGCLIATMENHSLLLRMQKSKQRLEITFYDQGLQVFYKGAAYIKHLDVIGRYGNLAKMSVAFQPCGELKAATAQQIDMTSGTTVSGVRMVFTKGLSTITMMKMSGNTIYVREVTVSTDTRITIQQGTVLVMGTAATVKSWLSAQNTSLINSSIIAMNTDAAPKSIVHKTTTTQTFSIVMNQGQLSTPTILSKF